MLRKEGNDPLLYMERKAYLEGLQTGLAGLDNARERCGTGAAAVA